MPAKAAAKASPPKTAAKAAPKAAAPAAPKAPAKAAPKAPAKAAPKPASPKETKPRPAAGSQNGVYVRNWGQGSVSDAKTIFSAAGNITAVQIRRRRYALVFFDSAAAVKKAIDLFNEKEILGSVVAVVPAKTSPKPDPHANSSVVFVSPIFRTSATDEQIKEIFAGTKVLRLRTYRQNHAYVYFDSAATAQKVVKEKNGSMFQGKKLRVALSTRSLAKEKERAERANLLMAAHTYKKEVDHTK